jgi:hypothetical protein
MAGRQTGGYDRRVDQRQAHAHAAWLNQEHPDRELFEWVALAQGRGKWAVVRMARRTRIDPLKNTVAAVPKPPQPEPPNVGPMSDLPFG